jgi:hypothetical protein
MTLICGHVAIYVHDLRAAEGVLPPRLRHGSPLLQFTDPFGFRWNVHANEVGFRSSGDIAGRWLD